MLTYSYTARETATGKKVKSEVEAQNEKAAAKLLQERGLLPLDIIAKADQQSFSDRIRKRIPTKERVIFSRQLSTLVNAGLPIVQSLRTASAQTKNKALQVILAKIISDVEAGSSLAEAMGRHPKVFDDVYISMVSAGEASGTLDVSLERLSNQQEKDADIISKVRGAMIYPLIVMAVMVVVVIFMLTTVLPQVQQIYNGLPGVQLPLVTRLLLAVSNILTHFWWVLIILLAIAVFLTSKWARTVGGKELIDRLKIHMWPIGPLFVKLYMARFSRTGATLVGSGVPMLKMLSITALAVNNVHVANSINKAAEKVKGGKALSESLQGDPNFPELVPNMIGIGEQSGALEAMLSKSADYYEKEVDNQVKAISTLVEPVLMIVMGVVALIIVAAILLPIYGLAGHLGTSPGAR